MEITTFLFTDSQIKGEDFGEDISNLLNSGEAPNLFAPDERMNVCEMVRAQAKTEGKAPSGSPAELIISPDRLRDDESMASRGSGRVFNPEQLLGLHLD